MRRSFGNFLSRLKMLDYNLSIRNSTQIKGLQLNNNIINVKRTIRDIEKDTFKTYFTSFLSPSSPASSSSKLIPIHPLIEIQKYEIDSINLNRNINIKIINSLDGKSLIEVFQNDSLSYRLDLSEIHDKVIGDEWFGGSSFSSNGKYFVYVAG